MTTTAPGAGLKAPERIIMSYYTGGANSWGTLVYTCPICGEIIAEYNTDADGVPTSPIFDNSDDHECDPCNLEH